MNMLLLLRLKTTGHGGEVYKGLLLKIKGSFILSRGWVVHAKKTSNKELKFCYIWYQSEF